MSSKQVKIKREDTEKKIMKEDESWEGWGEICQEESARPSTPPVPGRAAQTHKRPLSLTSPEQPPRPIAPVLPETPPRQKVLEVLELGEEEEEGKEEEEKKEDQAPPSQNTRATAYSKGESRDKEGRP